MILSCDHDHGDVIKKSMNDRISEGEGDQMIADTKEKVPCLNSAQNSPHQNPSVESDQAANNHRDS